jgi:hypothetical protein
MTSDPFAKLRNCGCLSCTLIVTVLDRQRAERATGWSGPAVLKALAAKIQGLMVWTPPTASACQSGGVRAHSRRRP